MTGSLYYDLEHLRDILRQVVSPDAACGLAIYLEGSIAEGFGNGTSDIDFVLVDPREADYPSMPSLHFVDGHRVEVRIRSARELERQLALVRALASSPRSAAARTVDEEVLDRCQRFRNSIPLQDAAAIARLKDELPTADLARAIERWFTRAYRQSFARALLCRQLGRAEEAEAYARSALAEAAKVGLARAGETYLAKKWISRQFARQPGLAAARTRFEALEQDSGSAAYLERVGRFIQDLLPEAKLPRPIFQLRRRPGITSWRLGASVHVLRGREDVFVLDPEALDVWRRVRFGDTVDALLADFGDNQASAQQTLHTFWQLGFVGIANADVGVLAGPSVSLPPTGERPILGLDGLKAPARGGGVSIAPLPAARFAACGMELAYVNMVVENAREDAAGALDAGQWKVVERSARRMLRSACQSVLSAHGVHPLPAQEEACSAMNRLTAPPPELARRVLMLDRGVAVTDRDGARALLAQTEDAIGQLQAAAGGRLFPRSFVSRAQWAGTLAIGYDWARLGAYVDADFPIHQARELISSGSQRPNAPRAAAP